MGKNLSLQLFKAGKTYFKRPEVPYSKNVINLTYTSYVWWGKEIRTHICSHYNMYHFMLAYYKVHLKYKSQWLSQIGMLIFAKNNTHKQQ